ncbi:hypothetical protein WJ66_04131, partial [Stenotrophomonas maltophilia WJ66]
GGGPGRSTRQCTGACTGQAEPARRPGSGRQA